MSSYYLRNDDYNPVDGNVFESFKKINSIFSANDGRRYYCELENACYDSDSPYTYEKQTHLRITKSEHDINCLGESYMKRKVKFLIQSDHAFDNVKLEYKLANGADVGAGDRGVIPQDAQDFKDHIKKVTEVFFGYKASNQSLRQLEIETDMGDTGYLQMECDKENFAYSTYKPRSERKTRKFVHSLYNNVQKRDNSVCGTYVNAFDVFTDTQEHEIGFEMIIPINDLLGLQAFDDYPKSFGEIILKYYNTFNSLVCVQVDPNRVADIQHFCYETLDEREYRNVTDKVYKYDREFQQIGLEMNMVTGVKYIFNSTKAGADDAVEGDRQKYKFLRVEPIVEPVRFNCRNMEIFDDKAVIPGYGIIAETAAKIPALFSRENPYMIPAQQIDIRTLNASSVRPEGITADFAYPLHNVTDVVLVFPTNPSQRTVFRNPMLQQLQVTIDSRNYPDVAMRTDDGTFFTRMLQASDLDVNYLI